MNREDEMETTEYLDEYYRNYDEDGRLGSRHGNVEFLTTMTYIQKYLRPGMRVLEIGAATGRYSHAIARMGYRVDAVELIEHNIELFRRNTVEGEQVTVTQGNAVELSGFEDGAYDVTLLLGPMYHIFEQEDKQRALSEAIRVTKKGGVVFVAYCMSDASIISYGFMRGEALDLVEKRLLDPQTFATASSPAELFELYRREDIDRLRSGFDVEQLHFVAADGFTNYMRGTIDSMDDALYELYLKYHLAVCERPDMVGYSHHTLDIFRKAD